MRSNLSYVVNYNAWLKCEIRYAELIQIPDQPTNIALSSQV